MGQSADTVHRHYRVEITLNIPQLDVLSRIDAKLDTIIQKENAIMASTQDILDEVAAESTIADSVLALVKQLVASGSDPAALQKILDGLTANKAKLQDAILAGTPQQP